MITFKKDSRNLQDKKTKKSARRPIYVVCGPMRFEFDELKDAAEAATALNFRQPSIIKNKAPP